VKRSAAALPLVVWAGALTAAAVLSVGAVAALLLAAAGRLDPPAVTALAVGTYAGLGLCLVVVAGAARLAGDLRALHSGAVRRLQEPSAPLEPLEPLLGRPLLTRASAELGELARVLAALHLRVRLADELGERHRRDAETAGAPTSGGPAPAATPRPPGREWRSCCPVWWRPRREREVSSPLSCTTRWRSPS